ncbi:hypothetical protein COSO111634_38405 [Corallococcus soli]
MICGFTVSFSSTFWRVMGAYSDPRPPSEPSSDGARPPVPPAPPVTELPRLVGLKPDWKGTFWPTVISASSLSLVSRCGVDSTFTSEDCCMALSTTPNAGMSMPRFLSSGRTGPWMPARKPPMLARFAREKDGGTPPPP